MEGEKLRKGEGTEQKGRGSVSVCVRARVRRGASGGDAPKPEKLKSHRGKKLQREENSNREKSRRKEEEKNKSAQSLLNNVGQAIGG